MVLDAGSPIARVSLTSADIADAMVTSSNQLLINGKTPGTISMFVWDRAGALRRYEVVVQRDLARLSEQMSQAVPRRDDRRAEQRQVDRAVRHRSRSKDVVDKAVNVAAGYVEKKEDIVTLLQLQDTGAATRCCCAVRFAEVSR